MTICLLPRTAFVQPILFLHSVCDEPHARCPAFGIGFVFPNPCMVRVEDVVAQTEVRGSAYADKREERVVIRIFDYRKRNTQTTRKCLKEHPPLYQMERYAITTEEFKTQETRKKHSVKILREPERESMPRTGGYWARSKRSPKETTTTSRFFINFLHFLSAVFFFFFLIDCIVWKGIKVAQN